MTLFQKVFSIGFVSAFALAANMLMPDLARAQSVEPQDAAPLTNQQRHAIVGEIVTRLNAFYIFPELAQVAGENVRHHEQIGDYARLDNVQDFARTVTQDLQAVTHDKHVRVRYSVPVAEEPDENGDPSPEEMKQLREMRQAINFGVQAVERSPANIGYVNFSMFAEADFSRETMTAAMTLIAHTDALIVDLRQGLGGEPATVAFVCSYLFDQRTHLSDLEDRGKPAEEFWTSAAVPGPHFGGSKPVFVLTSNKTFSGAEEFAYDLQQLHRATIVGETTGGGANPGEDHRVAEHLTLFIPDSRSINPYSGTNWDGVGVTPGVKVSADEARRMAEKLILQQLIKTAPDSAFFEERRKLLLQIEEPS